MLKANVSEHRSNGPHKDHIHSTKEIRIPIHDPTNNIRISLVHEGISFLILNLYQKQYTHSTQYETGTEAYPMDINYVEVGRRIRDARKHRGLTAETLSEKVGLATDSLRHIEIAASYPSLQTLYRIAAVLEVSLDYITGRTPTLTDSLVLEYGLTTQQEDMLRDMIECLIPIITERV